MIIALRGRFSAPTNSSIVVVGDDVFSFAAAGGKLFRHRGGAVENGDGEAFRFHVEDEVFAHHGEADQANITLIRVHFGYLLLCAGAGIVTLRASSRPWQFRFGKFRSPAIAWNFRPDAFDVQSGAVVDFWGVVRALEDGREIAGIEYEAHQPMAEHQMNLLAEEARNEFGLTSLILRHRVGFVPAGEASLFLRVAAGHRAAAFSGSQWIDRGIEAEGADLEAAIFKDKESAIDKKMSKEAVTA